MSNVNEVINGLREKELLSGKLARVLGRIRHILVANNVIVSRTRKGSVGAYFNCPTEAAAYAIIRELHSNAVLEWPHDPSAYKQAEFEMYGLSYQFTVSMVREVSLAACEIKRMRSRPNYAIRTAKMIWRGKVLAEVNFRERLSREDLFDLLRMKVLKTYAEGGFKQYRFV